MGYLTKSCTHGVMAWFVVLYIIIMEAMLVSKYDPLRLRNKDEIIMHNLVQLIIFCLL